MDPEENLIKDKLKKLEKINEKGINPYPYSFDKKYSSKEIKEKYKNIKFNEFSEETTNYAGRIITKRILGKIAFFTLRDEHEDLQIVFRANQTKDYENIELLDLGDFIGVKGKVSKTKAGEISIFSEEFQILSKSIRPLPEKYHGIQEPELKQRYRHLDLIMNLDSRDLFRKRHLIIKEIRDFLYNNGFIELETPILQQVYGGANARPFITHHNVLDEDLYLRISLELYLKRLIIGGYEKVFEIGKNFRNEGIDTMHNPEFTMLELYQAYVDYNEMMRLTESLIKHLAKNILKKDKFKFKGNIIDVNKKFSVISMTDVIKKYINLDVLNMTEKQLRKIIQENEIELNGEITKGSMINAIFEELVQEKLIQPTFVIDYPTEVSPLTKKHRQKPGFTERFELFISGEEFANAYSELNDPIDQKQRFEMQEKNRRKGDEEVPPKDEDFIKALESGMPPAGGLGIGIDRLVMFLTEQDSIRDVIPFVLLKRNNENEK